MVLAALVLVQKSLAAPQDRTGGPSTPAPAKSGPAAGNKVLILDGKRAFLSIPDSATLRAVTNEMTIEVWVKAASFYPFEAGINTIVRKNIQFGQQKYFLRFRSFQRQPVLEIACGNRNGLLSAAYDFQPGRWYHIAATLGGGRLTAYVNGVAIGGRPAARGVEPDPSEILVGRGDPTYSRGEYFHGALDDLRIWSVARTPEQLKAGMSARLTGTEPGLVAMWNFDDGNATDGTGHGNNGSFVAGARCEAAAAPDASAPPDPTGSWEPVDAAK
jgi:hypothetical protein